MLKGVFKNYNFQHKMLCVIAPFMHHLMYVQVFTGGALGSVKSIQRGLQIIPWGWMVLIT